MSALSARNPMLSDPRADCVAGKSPGFPGVVRARVNGEDGPSVSTLKPLTTTSFRLTSGSEYARRNLDASSELWHLESTPFCRALVVPLPLSGSVQ